MTQEKAYWLLPSRGKKILYGPVSDMNFTSPSTQKKGMDKEIAGDERKEKKRKERKVHKYQSQQRRKWKGSMKNCQNVPANLPFSL